ncbi:MAG: hypothetical protein ABW007_00675 [Chitinophagaceae bacterium]
MTNEQITSSFPAVSVSLKSTLTLKQVIKRGHPVMREQKRQLLAGIAILMMVVVLLYPFTDWNSGSRNPALLLICGLTLPIINNLLAYRFVCRPFAGKTVLENYQQERRNIKTFTILTALLRGLSAGVLIGCLFLSFRLDEVRMWILRGILLLYVADLAYIIRLWIKRFGRLLANLDYFHNLIYPEDPS